jgi:hypothetical protein
MLLRLLEELVVWPVELQSEDGLECCLVLWEQVLEPQQVVSSELASKSLHLRVFNGPSFHSSLSIDSAATPKRPRKQKPLSP